MNEGQLLTVMVRLDRTIRINAVLTGSTWPAVLAGW
jgi:hypothetical protein